MAFTFTQSFDPRIGTMQKIFGVIYVLITLVAISLAFYVRSIGQDGYLQFFMAVLFGIMALKSFYIANRVKNLLKNGVYFKAKVDSVEPVRGITVIKGIVEIPDFGPIYIESRLAGETPARELQRYLDERKQEFLPALVVGAQGKHPRGMFTIKCKNGHLDESSAELQDENAQQQAQDQADNATAAATETQTALDSNVESKSDAANESSEAAADNSQTPSESEPKANDDEPKAEAEIKADSNEDDAQKKAEASAQESEQLTKKD